MLFSTTKPGDEYAGYIMVRGGNEGLSEYQGAVDLPFAPGLVSVRLAGDITKQTGYVVNLNGGDHLGDTDAKSTETTQLSEELQLLGKVYDEQLKYIVGVYTADNRELDDFGVTVGGDLPTPLDAIHYHYYNTDRTYATFLQGTYDLSKLTGLSGLSFTAGYRYTRQQLALTQIGDSVFIGAAPQSMRESAPSWQIGPEYQITPAGVRRQSWELASRQL